MTGQRYSESFWMSSALTSPSPLLVVVEGVEGEVVEGEVVEGGVVVVGSALWWWWWEASCV